MSPPGPPTMAPGKLCYLEIPSTDITRSAAFYERVFGWNIRRRGDGNVAFDDAVGQVSGTWVVGRPPMAEPGLMIYIMMVDAAATVDAVVAEGCEIVRPIDPAAGEVFAWFRDPSGNVLGIYQEPSLAAERAAG